METSKPDSRGRKPNRLINEQSPYLRQHAHNPVDWYPWGEEALERAKRENKPILLSIGYSACHWCHVMERESFENEEIARQMNELFVSIKVDREERPDLDQIYMDAVQLFAGRGGWPLTMFLTPEGKPFFGGTYYPPEDRHGMPGFPRILAAISDAYNNRADDVRKNVDKLTAALKTMGEFKAAEGDIDRELPEKAARALSQHYDSINGGLGKAPKFPNTFVFSLLTRIFAEEGGEDLAEMVAHTLEKMAKGGIYDQLGGGFHRYSVDDRWLVPHFEKMLYDNALLSRLYLDAGRAFGRTDFLNVAREILEYVLREMTDSRGGFYSTQDADSEGHEGKFFVWSLKEVRSILGPELSPLAERYFDVSEEGNFESQNILHRTVSIADLAKLLRRPEEEVARGITDIRRKLFEVRERRIHPGRDEKILTAWNGMMISSLAEGYRALGDERFLQAAKKAVQFAMTTMWDGRALKRSFKDGAARFNAYLEDYALLANAFIDVHEASFEQEYLEHARSLIDVLLERFLDRENGGFFFTSEDHEQLIVRSKPVFDGSTPSGNGEALLALLRLHAYTGEGQYRIEAERGLRVFRPLMEQQPFGFAHMLEVTDFYLRGPTEIVLAGRKMDPELASWIQRIGHKYVPNRAIYVVDTERAAASYLPEAVRGKGEANGRLTGYVCRDFTCSLPQNTVEGLEAELSK